MQRTDSVWRQERDDPARRPERRPLAAAWGGHRAAGHRPSRRSVRHPEVRLPQLRVHPRSSRLFAARWPHHVLCVAPAGLLKERTGCGRLSCVLSILACGRSIEYCDDVRYEKARVSGHALQGGYSAQPDGEAAGAAGRIRSGWRGEHCQDRRLTHRRIQKVAELRLWASLSSQLADLPRQCFCWSRHCSMSDIGGDIFPLVPLLSVSRVLSVTRDFQRLADYASDAGTAG